MPCPKWLQPALLSRGQQPLLIKQDLLTAARARRCIPRVDPSSPPSSSPCLFSSPARSPPVLELDLPDYRPGRMRPSELRRPASVLAPSPSSASLSASCTNPTGRNNLGVEWPTRRWPDRAELVDILQELQKLWHSSFFSSECRAQAPLISQRIRLALHNLRQQPLHETIRVAVLEVPAQDSLRLPPSDPAQNPGHSPLPSPAARFLRLLLADPRPSPQEWERELAKLDLRQGPVIMRLVKNEDAETEKVPKISLDLASSTRITELRVSSPRLTLTSDVEFVISELDEAKASLLRQNGPILDPLVTTLVNAETMTTIPVHLTLMVGHGLSDRADLVSALRNWQPHRFDLFKAALDMKSYNPQDVTGSPIIPVCFEHAEKAFQQFRQDASAFELLWAQSKFGEISKWLERASRPPSDGTENMNSAVACFISSILRDVRATTATQESLTNHHISTSSPTPPSAHFTATLPALGCSRALSAWAQSAHEELQDQLDRAFSGHLWRQLSWWKLFWRVDDVAMHASTIITQSFLPTAEKNMIYLAGCIDQAGFIDHTLVARGNPPYPGCPVGEPPSLVDDVHPATVSSSSSTSSTGPSPNHRNLSPPSSPPPPYQQQPQQRDRSGDATISPPAKWPTHIPYTRTYLINKSVPALQALAQGLICQVLTQSGLCAALGTLTYLYSSFTAYEVGTVVAVGLTWSLRNMQTKWEAKRSFWEGEVCEEGRKALRAVEESMAKVLVVARIRELAQLGEEVLRRRWRVEDEEE